MTDRCKVQTIDQAISSDGAIPDSCIHYSNTFNDLLHVFLRWSNTDDMGLPKTYRMLNM